MWMKWLPEPSSNAAAAVAVEAASPELQAMIAAELTRVLAQRDEQIAELQQAVMELAEMRPSEAVASPPEPDLEPLLAAIVDLTRRINRSKRGPAIRTRRSAMSSPC
jgi:hypothetical protein